MRTTLFILTLLLFSCGNRLNRSNSTENGITDSTNVSSKNLELVVEFPIRIGSCFEKKDIENWDYPKDLQAFHNILFLLAGNEPKMVGYDLSTRQLVDCKKINLRLQSEKNEDSTISAPTFLRISDKHIIVGYDFKILVFSSDQKFLYKLLYNTHIPYITLNNTKLNIWAYDYVMQLNLGDTNDVHKIVYGDNKLDLVDLVVGMKDEIATHNTTSIIEGLSIKSYPIKCTPYEIMPKVKEENFSLDYITDRYYVWYPWTNGSKVVLVNKQNEKSKVLDLGINITQNNLSNMEDRSGGLKIAGEDKMLYFMVMVNANNEKAIRIYKLDIK